MDGLWDIHCHIVPGVDDGAKDMEEARKMLQTEYRNGVRNIIATPHFRKEMFEPSPDSVKKQFHLLKEMAYEIADDLHIYLGCELHASIGMEKGLKEGTYLSMAGTRYVLTEFRNNVKEAYMKERLMHLLSYGYRPIIAHAERCRIIYENMYLLEELREMGALIQMNADSISGEDGFRMKMFCKKVIKNDLLDFVGTDGHGIYHRVPKAEKCYKRLEKLRGKPYADQIFINNPEKILG